MYWSMASIRGEQTCGLMCCWCVNLCYEEGRNVNTVGCCWLEVRCRQAG